jgi:hypothetical protein
MISALDFGKFAGVEQGGAGIAYPSAFCESSLGHMASRARVGKLVGHLQREPDRAIEYVFERSQLSSSSYKASARRFQQCFRADMCFLRKLEAFTVIVFFVLSVIAVLKICMYSTIDCPGVTEICRQK